MAFETLIATLGRLFEPYVIRLLPFLLVCFGDGNKDVRDAAEDAARAIVKYVHTFLCMFLIYLYVASLQGKRMSREGADAEGGIGTDRVDGESEREGELDIYIFSLSRIDCDKMKAGYRK